jgi:transcriptional regulator with XRE-family HTH domain
MSIGVTVEVPFPLSRLASLRRAKKLTQEDVSRLANVRPDVVSVIERSAQPGDAIERIIGAVLAAPIGPEAEAEAHSG